MIGIGFLDSGSKALWLLRLPVICVLLTSPFACAENALTATASDNFNRANGGLGTNWSDISDGGLAISSQVAAGTAASGVSGDAWNAQTFSSDQFSQVRVTSTRLTGGQWIGPMVRAQNSGQNAYVGIYNWNNGSPNLMLFKRSGSSWAQLGRTYNSGPLAAGTQLEVKATGSTISFLQNGVSRISATDTSLSGGAPGIMAYGTGQVGNWSGGNFAGYYSVGGTVSGLTGTVVLQDNGGDSLSLSANGPFTFATPLASGTTYDVRVKSYPTGQTCTISSGYGGTIAAANITNVAVSCMNSTTVSSASDAFNRADGSLGPNWADISDGGMTITSHAVAGTGPGTSGDIRTAESYTSDQYSQIQVTAAQLIGSQWIGSAVRVHNRGQDAYVGIYSWNNGRPNLMLFKRSGGLWTQLGSSYDSGPLAAGTQLKLMVVGSTIAFMQNGVERIAVGDTSLSGGAPGIMASGTGQAGNWSGGTASFEVHYLSTDANGVASYDVISAKDSDGPQVLRVLNPTNPAAGVKHNFLFVLPVESGLGKQFGDGLQTLRSLNAQNQYNLTIVEPSFGIDPWYADSPTDPSVQYETFMTKELVPWAQKNLATTGSEQNWLIGFSKSGMGGEDLILKYPGIFTLAATWDFPADMSSYKTFGADSAAGYGSDANYQANYRLTAAFLSARKGPFLTNNRIWIGGYALYQTDVSDYDKLLTSQGIVHSTETPTRAQHRWDSGWVPIAVAALYQDSINLH